jgi:hypothetical protein
VVVAVMGLFASSSIASAQVTHMNSGKKLAYFKLFTGVAKKKVAEGKPGTAKVLCLSAFYLIKNQLRIPRWPQRNQAALKAYDSVCDALYKNHKADPAGGVAVVAQYKDKITEYGHALAFPPFGRARTNSAGYLSPFERYKRIVEQPLIYKTANAHAVEFVEKLPTLNAILQSKVRGVDALLPRLLEIVTGKFAGDPLIKKTAIPGIVKEVDKQVSQFRATWHPDRMAQAATQMNKWIRLLKQADPKHPKIARYAAEIAKMKVAVAKRYKAFMAKQRMPKGKYRGANKAGLVATVRANYRASYPKEKILRVVVAAEDWSPARGAGWWKGNVWHWSVFSRLTPVAIAVEQRIKGKKSYRVFKITMARERKGRGWSKPYMVGGTGYGAPILKKNIHK